MYFIPPIYFSLYDIRFSFFAGYFYPRQCDCQCAPRQAVLYQRSNRLVVESHKTLSKLTKTKTNVHTVRPTKMTKTHDTHEHRKKRRKAKEEELPNAKSAVECCPPKQGEFSKNDRPISLAT